MSIGFLQVEREEEGIPVECSDTNGLTVKDARVE